MKYTWLWNQHKKTKKLPASPVPYTSLYTENLEYLGGLLLAHFSFFMGGTGLNGHNTRLPKGRIWSDHLNNRKHSFYVLHKRERLGFSHANPKANLSIINYFWTRCHSRASNKPQTVKLFSCLWTYVLTYRIVSTYKAPTKMSSLPESQRKRKGLCTSLKHLFTVASSTGDGWLLE